MRVGRATSARVSAGGALTRAAARRRVSHTRPTRRCRTRRRQRSRTTPRRARRAAKRSQQSRAPPQRLCRARRRRRRPCARAERCYTTAGHAPELHLRRCVPRRAGGACPGGHAPRAQVHHQAGARPSHCARAHPAAHATPRRSGGQPPPRRRLGRPMRRRPAPAVSPRGSPRGPRSARTACTCRTARRLTSPARTRRLRRPAGRRACR
jgi:hypothetical protein